MHFFPFFFSSFTDQCACHCLSLLLCGFLNQTLFSTNETPMNCAVQGTLENHIPLDFFSPSGRGLAGLVQDYGLMILWVTCVVECVSEWRPRSTGASVSSGGLGQREGPETSRIRLGEELGCPLQEMFSDPRMGWGENAGLHVPDWFSRVSGSFFLPTCWGNCLLRELAWYFSWPTPWMPWEVNGAS